MKLLILASTAAQLMNAMTLAVTDLSHDDVDLAYGAGIENKVNVAHQLGYFHMVYRMPVMRSIINMDTVLKKLKGTIDIALFWKTLIKKYPVDPKEYDRILIPGIALSYFIHYYSIHAANKKLKLSIYEEGICEYYTLGFKNGKKARMQKAIFGEYYYEKCDSVYVHHPEIVDNIWSNIVIKKMDSPINHEKLRNDLMIVMCYTDSGIQKDGYKYVFVDAAHPAMDDEAYREEKQKEALEYICSLVGTDKVAIKLHPASPKNKYGEKYHYLDFNYPLELIGLKENIDEMTFISIASSATVNFKLLLDKEPQVIILQDVLFGNGEIDKHVTDLFYRVKSTYSEDRFFIPANYDELRSCLVKTNKSNGELHGE